MADTQLKLVDESTLVQIEGDTALLAPFVDAAEASAASAAASASSAANSATAAAGSAGAASASAVAAASARDLAEAAALTAPNVYSTAAAGLAAVSEGQTFWVQGTKYPELYREVSGVAVRIGQLGHFAGIPLTMFGAIPDAKMIQTASMSSGSAVLTSSAPAFSAGDVGKAVVVAGAAASAGRLKTTISSYQSATQVTLAGPASTTTGTTGAAWGTDCSAALVAALMAIDTSKGGSILIDGDFLLLQPASHVFPGPGANHNTHLRLQGTGTDSTIICALSSTDDAISLTNAFLEAEEVSFVGLHGVGHDVRNLVYLNACRASFRRCQFFGLFGKRSIIFNQSGYLSTEYCSFGGSFVDAPPGDAEADYGSIENDDWYSYTDRYSEHIDYGYWKGMLLGKSGYAANLAWIRVRNPAQTGGARAPGTINLTGFVGDEGATSLAVIPDADKRVYAVEMVNCRSNVSPVDASQGVYAQYVDNLLIDRCAFGWSTRPNTDFAEIHNCTNVTVNQVVLHVNVNSLTASSVTSLTVRDCEIAHLNFTSVGYHPEDSRYTPHAIVKSSAVSDADFGAPPAPGTSGIDRENGRLYVRGGGGWFYFQNAGGDLLGPELVTNGTFAVDASGWSAGNATLSVVSGALRVTNNSVFGQASQSVTVEAGKSYRLTVGSAAGTAGGFRITAGESPGNNDNYVNQTAAGSYDFTATGTEVVVVLGLNTETVGEYGDFDNVSLREI